MPIVCKVAAKTDKGLVRQGNEDSLFVASDQNVFAVCDGMGGAQAGEVASLTAAQLIGTSFSHFQKELLEDASLKIDRKLPPSADILIKSIRLANREIHNMAVTDPTLSGMGTTIVALALEADYMSIAHVGDSRAYRITERNLIPLTVDHSWVQELQDSQGIRLSDAEVAVGRNVITRALGVRKDVEVDYRLVKVKPGDKFLLCSDGLCGYATDDEIFDVIKRAEGDINKTADLLVKSANERGGMDNVSVIALEIEKVDNSPMQPVDLITLPSENEELLLAEDIWLTKLKEKQQNTESDETGNEEKSETSKATLIAIFAAFLIVVVFIIYLVAGK
ncbi:MAG: Stp1/IreP family PP2C-type Ser/Thr phosphatase [Candidatus Zixiibacteriota bacterium]